MFTHTLHDDEQLLRIYRKHEITLTAKIVEVFLLLFVPWFFGLKYNFIFSSPLHAKIFAGWTLLIGLYTAQMFVIWAINVYIITSKRLLHISHNGIFHKTVNETPLDRILNVSFRTTGFFSTLFHYGDVLVTVVGLEKPLTLTQVPNPVEIKDFIWDIHLQYGGEQKITYTKPEIAPANKEIPYGPQISKRIIKSIKKKKNCLIFASSNKIKWLSTKN